MLQDNRESVEAQADDSALLAGISTDWQASVQEDIRGSEYQVTYQEVTYLADVPAAYQAPNRAQGLRSYFTPDGVRVIPRTQPGEWELGLSLVGLGYAGQMQPVEMAELVASANRVDYRRPVVYQGEVFYTTTIQMPDDVPGSGRFYLSAEPDAVAEVVVDDAVMIFAEGVLVFTYVFSDGTYVPESTIVELPRTVMEGLAGQTITVEYRDVYAVVVRASPMWLIWTP